MSPTTSYTSDMGATHVTVAVINSMSGRVWFAPFEVEDAAVNGHPCDHGTAFRIDSELFEADGAVHKAISVVKKRTGKHEHTIRELFIDGPNFIFASENVLASAIM